MPWTISFRVEGTEPGESEEEVDEETVDEVEEEAEDSGRDPSATDESKDAGPRYTEHVLERVMKPIELWIVKLPPLLTPRSTRMQLLFERTRTD